MDHVQSSLANQTYFVYFLWEEREREINMFEYFGQLSVPQGNKSTAAGHAHSMEIKTSVWVGVTVLSSW